METQHIRLQSADQCGDVGWGSYRWTARTSVGRCYSQRKKRDGGGSAENEWDRKQEDQRQLFISSRFGLERRSWRNRPMPPVVVELVESRDQVLHRSVLSGFKLPHSDQPDRDPLQLFQRGLSI